MGLIFVFYWRGEFYTYKFDANILISLMQRENCMMRIMYKITYTLCHVCYKLLLCNDVHL